MTNLSRDWLATFADPAVRSDLRAAARSCMDYVDEDPDEPEPCGHRQVDLMTPMEFVDWVEREVLLDRQRPTPMRSDHRANMSRAATDRWHRTRLETARAV